MKSELQQKEYEVSQLLFESEKLLDYNLLTQCKAINTTYIELLININTKIESCHESILFFERLKSLYFHIYIRFM